ncbi:hydroxypyruvate isomerase family protein [Sulfitobacter aestuariivivens]|uniref:TIM barrel protein n=1 Tax=Sulfitobacter aestuariivivens TaxID=2766981 RepID=A0A927D5I6_9RHOB|nr:TIM barrel protein [Sulfitobacter aestuariivivens]MBD3665580.1 TIM barrel protein [Sulfitobacter aestuariivivens]
MKLAANLTLLWPELPYLDRFDAARKAGFDAVEILFPYDVAVAKTQAALTRNGLQMILLNAPPPNDTGTPRGFAADLAQTDRFRSDMRLAFEFAQALSAEMIHVMTGPGAGARARDTLIGNMRWACAQAPAGITLMLEPLNQTMMPGYFLSDYALAADVIAAVEANNIALQFDSYHAQMIHADAVQVFDQYRPLIRHIQIGDTPDRGAPGSGAVDFDTLFERIRISGYDRWVSGEYHPGMATEKTLDWMKYA